MSNNPYAPSEIEAAAPATIKTEQELRAIQRQLDTECSALAAFWFVVGLILVPIGEFGRQNLPTVLPYDWGSLIEAAFSTSCFLMGGVGIAWVVLGVLTHFRYEPAIQLALMTTYALLLFPAVWMTVFGLLFLGLGIAQGHRVLNCAADLRNAKEAHEVALADVSVGTTNN